MHNKCVHICPEDPQFEPHGWRCHYTGRYTMSRISFVFQCKYPKVNTSFFNLILSDHIKPANTNRTNCWKLFNDLFTKLILKMYNFSIKILSCQSKSIALNLKIILKVAMHGQFLYVLTNGIQHKAAITVCDQCLLILIAALCFIPYCGHINKWGPIHIIKGYKTELCQWWPFNVKQLNYKIYVASLTFWYV